MATIQAKTSRGHEYWYIVESRRVNGKPRPIVLACLGKPLDLLRRLQGLTGPLRVKSYAHGAVAALLKVVAELQVADLINAHVRAQRPYFAEKPLRNRLTVGITLVLAAIGRACTPTSKQGWWQWAKTRSCEFLPRAGLSKWSRSQIRSRWPRWFWMPEATGGKTGIPASVLFPLFQLNCQGNLNDVNVFAQVTAQIKTRLQELGMDLEKHTLVFYRGNSSQKNLRRIQRQHLHYVGALRPSDHRMLVAEAENSLIETDIDGSTLQLYRDRREIWGCERTVVVLISERLKAGQLRGIYQELDRKKGRLRELQCTLANPRAKRRSREELEAKIRTLPKGQYTEGLIRCRLEDREDGRFALRYRTCRKTLEQIEDRLGFRILMTDRHDWSTAEIISAYYSQSAVEHAFRNLKNPHHLAIRPQYHWTDHKIRIHFFACVLGYMLSALIRQTARKECNFVGTAGSLIEALSNSRLATLIEATGKRGKPKANHQLEALAPQEETLVEALGIAGTHKQRPKIDGVGVYA